VADYAAGWHRNSVLPDQGGNVVLSAHHNIKGQVFRYTVDLEPGDLITLYDATQSYDYLVEDKFIVKDKGEPEAVRLENAKWIGPFNEERLTLITCWPFNSNTHRLIVIAKPAGTG
jgi:sortase A